MKKARKFFALIGALLLIGLYISTIVLAFMQNDMANRLLQASVFSTAVIPIILYGFTLAIRLNKKDEMNSIVFDKDENAEQKKGAVKKLP